MNRVQDYVPPSQAEGSCDSLQTCKEVVGEYPVTSVMAAFGIGIGVGAIIGSVIAGPEPTPHSTAAAIGRRVLDSLQDYLPNSLRG